MWGRWHGELLDIRHRDVPGVQRGWEGVLDSIRVWDVGYALGNGGGVAEFIRFVVGGVVA